MRFNVIAAVAALPMAFAAPALNLNPSVPAGTALSVVQSLNQALTTHSGNINSTLAQMSASSPQDQKDAATKNVGSEFQAMTVAISQAIGQLGDKANNVQTRQSGGSAQGLADALQTTLSMVAGTVNTAVAVLGLTPLLVFLTPLTGSLSGLVLSLKTVVDQLLPVLNTVLDGVVVGLSQALGGIIL